MHHTIKEIYSFVRRLAIWPLLCSPQTDNTTTITVHNMSTRLAHVYVIKSLICLCARQTTRYSARVQRPDDNDQRIRNTHGSQTTPCASIGKRCTVRVFAIRTTPYAPQRPKPCWRNKKWSGVCECAYTIMALNMIIYLVEMCAILLCRLDNTNTTHTRSRKHLCSTRDFHQPFARCVEFDKIWFTLHSAVHPHLHWSGSFYPA